MHIGIADSAGAILYWCAIAAFLISAAGRPQIGIYYIVPLLPLQTLRYRLHAYPLGANVVDIVLLGVAIGLWRNGSGLIPKTPFNRLFAVYGIYCYLLLWLGAFVLNSEPPLWIDNIRFRDWKNYMMLFVMCLLVYGAIRTTKQIKILLLCMCLTVVALDRSYFHTLSDRDLSHFSYDVRDEGAMGYAGVNGFAAFQAQFIFVLAGLLIFERRKIVKCGYAALIALASYCLLFSFSRGAYTALIAGWAFLGVVRARWLLIVLLIVIVSWQAIVPASVQERILMTEGEEGEVEHSAGVRLTLWEDAVALFKADPIFGTGFNTYQYMERVESYRDTHNLYLKVLVETGLVGIGIFLWLYWRMFATGFQLYTRSETDLFKGLGLGFASMMVCVFVANIFGDRWMYPQISGYTFALLAMCLRGMQILRDNEGAEGDGAAQSEPDQATSPELTEA